MVLTSSYLLCLCKAKLLSAEWFLNSFFQFSLAYDCLELFHTVLVVVCYVVHSLHPQMAYATPSQIKKSAESMHHTYTQRHTHTSGFDQKQNQKAGTTSQLEQNHFFFSTQFQLEPFLCYGYFSLFTELKCMHCPKTITSNDWTQ